MKKITFFRSCSWSAQVWWWPGLYPGPPTSWYIPLNGKVSYYLPLLSYAGVSSAPDWPLHPSDRPHGHGPGRPLQALRCSQPSHLWTAVRS